MKLSWFTQTLTYLESCWSDYVTELGWKHLRMLLKELEEVSREREVWASLVGLLSPVPDKQEKMESMDENYIISDLCNELFHLIGQT